MGLLRAGQRTQTIFSRMPCEIGALRGSGTQGEVYGVTLSGQQFALKWYWPEYIRRDTGLRERLGVAIRSGPPTDKFLWPFDLASTPEASGFGYLMPFLLPHFRTLVDLMAKKVDPSFRVLATVGLNLAHSFLQVHAKGFCYRDINFGNVFFDPDSGDVRIGDNDNVDINGRPGLVEGTPGFMAPEIIRREAAPSIETDLYSLSVLLFYIFMVHHPLAGKREWSVPIDKLYAVDPIFIFDPQDHSNEPVVGYHDNAITFWPIYPQFLRELFTRTFTAGIRDPLNGRVREGEWRQAMCTLRDSVYCCSNCGIENFYDIESVKALGRPRDCWHCGEQLQMPARLRVRKKETGRPVVIILNPDTKLFPHHLDSDRLYEFSQPVAMVTTEPLRLKNLSAQKWVSRTADNRLEDVPPGASVPLSSATKIYFGKAEGEVRL